MVKVSFSYINKIDDDGTRLELIRTIKDVCEKKIFLEVSYLNLLMIFFRLSMLDVLYYW